MSPSMQEITDLDVQAAISTKHSANAMAEQSRIARPL